MPADTFLNLDFITDCLINTQGVPLLLNFLSRTYLESKILRKCRDYNNS